MENEEEPWNEDEYDFDRRRLTVQKKERIDDPDYEQPQVHLHTVPQARPEPQGAPVSVTGPQSTSSKPDICCLVKGCHADLLNSKAYYRRFRICETHMKSLSLSIEGRSCRFCQQCGKFHLVEEFDGANRNCRKALMIRFYKRRNMPLTNLQAASGRSDAQAPTTAANAPSHQELMLEPRKRGRPRAPRPDILEEEHAATSGGSGPGSPPRAGAAAARAAAAAGFDSALQAAYMAASRGYQGSTGVGVTPATAIGPPGYSQGGVRMAGIEIDEEMDNEYECRTSAIRRRSTAAVHLLAADIGGGGKLEKGRRRPGGSDRGGYVSMGPHGMVSDDMQTQLPPGAQAQLEALQGLSGHRVGAKAGGGAGLRGYASDAGRLGGVSGSLSQCSSSHSQDPDEEQTGGGGGGGGVSSRGRTAPSHVVGDAIAAAVTGGGSDGTREAADTLTALGGSLAPLVDAGVVSGSVAQMGLASLLGGLGGGGLLQVLPMQPSGEGPRLQFFRSQAAGQTLEGNAGRRAVATDADNGQPASSWPSHTSTRSSDELSVARRALKLGGYSGGGETGGMQLPHRELLTSDCQDHPLSSDEQQQRLQRQQQQFQQEQRRSGSHYLRGIAGNGKMDAVPRFVAVTKREGVEILSDTHGSKAATAAVTGHEAERGVRLPLRDVAAAGDSNGADSFLSMQRLVTEARWNSADVGSERPGLWLGTSAAEGTASGLSFDRDREFGRGTLGLDVSSVRSGTGAIQSALQLGQDSCLSASEDGRRGNRFPGVLALDVGTRADTSRCRGMSSCNGNGIPLGTVFGGTGGIGIGGGGGGSGGVQYIRLEPGVATSVEHARLEMRRLGAAESQAPASPSPITTDEEMRNAAVARLLSQMSISQQLDVLQQMPHDQMFALLQMLPHAQQVALLLKLQDERRMKVMQEQQQVLILPGRGGDRTSAGSATTLTLDLALDPASTAPARRAAVAPVPLCRNTTRPQLASLGLSPQEQSGVLLSQHEHHEAGEAIRPMEFVTIASAGTRLQRMPDGSAQVVLALPVTASPPGATPSAMPILRLQTSSAGPPATVQLATAEGAVPGTSAISLPGNGSVLLNLGNGSIRLPSSALMVRGGTGAFQGGKAAADYGNREDSGCGASDDVLERLSLKLHGMRPEQLAPDVAQRLQAWLKSMDAVTLQGTLRSGCVNLVLDINLRPPTPGTWDNGRQTEGFVIATTATATAGGDDVGKVSLGELSPGGASLSLADIATGGTGYSRIADGGGAAAGDQDTPDCVADRLAAAALAAALGLDVGLIVGNSASCALSAVGAEAAAMGVRAMVQVGSRVVYPQRGWEPSSMATPIVCELAPLAIVQGVTSVVHMVGMSFDSTGARLHARLNGRRLGAFLQLEAELNDKVNNAQPPAQEQQEQEQQGRPQPQLSLSQDAQRTVERSVHCALSSCYSSEEDSGKDSCVFNTVKPEASRTESEAAKSSSHHSKVTAGVEVAASPFPRAELRQTGAQPRAGSEEPTAWSGAPKAEGAVIGSLETHASDGNDGLAAAASMAAALVYLDPPSEAGLAVLEWETGVHGVLGSWWPLVVAPNEEVAAEINSFVAQQPRRQPPRTLGSVGANSTGLEGDLCKADPEDDETAVDISWIGSEDIPRLHKLLTDLGLVLDALHNHSSSSCCFGGSYGKADVGRIGSVSNGDIDDGNMDAGAWETEMRSLLQRLRSGENPCGDPLSRSIADSLPAAHGSCMSAAACDVGSGSNVLDDTLYAPHPEPGQRESATSLHSPVTSFATRGLAHSETRHIASTSCVNPPPSTSSSMSASLLRAARSATAAAEEVQAYSMGTGGDQLLDCYVRRAKRLLPICLARAMPHTAAEVLHFLTRIARVPFGELLLVDLHTQTHTQARTQTHEQHAGEQQKRAGLRHQSAVTSCGDHCDGAFSLLHVAASSGCVGCVELVLRAGLQNGVLLNPLATGPDGWTPLRLAAAHDATRGSGAGAGDVVNLLVSYLDAAGRTVAEAAPLITPTPMQQLIIKLSGSNGGGMPDVRERRLPQERAATASARPATLTLSPPPRTANVAVELSGGLAVSSNLSPPSGCTIAINNNVLHNDLVAEACDLQNPPNFGNYDDGWDSEAVVKKAAMPAVGEGGGSGGLPRLPRRGGGGGGGGISDSYIPGGPRVPGTVDLGDGSDSLSSGSCSLSLADFQSHSVSSDLSSLLSVPEDFIIENDDDSSGCSGGEEASVFAAACGRFQTQRSVVDVGCFGREDRTTRHNDIGKGTQVVVAHLECATSL